MRNQSIRILVLLGFGATALLAANFWDTKKFTEWSDSQINKMLTDSPWAHKTTVQVKGGAGRGGGRMSPEPQDEGMGGGMRGGGPGGGGMGGMGGGMGGGGMRGGGDMAPQVARGPEAVVRWQTALPIKQMAAFSRYRDEVETSPDAAALLNREERNYIVGVIGLPPYVAAGKKEEFAAGAQLVIKNLPPIQAVGADLQQVGRGADLYLVFPKTDPGAHVIALDDKEVQVIVETDTLHLKQKFNLKNMVYQGKLEL